MRISVSALHALWRILVICLLLVFLLSAGLAYFVQRNPRALLQGYVDDIAAATGLSITFDTLDVRLLPLPSLAVSNAVIQGGNMSFSVAYATLTPDYLALLRGQLLPGEVLLLRPRVRGMMAAPLDGADALVPLFAGNSTGGEPSLPAGCRMRIMQGEVRLQGSEETRMEVYGLQCDLKARASGALSGTLQWQAAAVYRGKALRISLEDFLCSGESDLHAPLTATPGMRLMGRWHYAPWLESLVMDMHFRSHAGAWQVETALSGDLRKDASLLPFSLRGLCSGQAGQNRLDITDVDFVLDADSGRFSGALMLPAATGGGSLQGSLQVHRLSLTQWLGFARNLAPGLQLALDNITRARLDLHLDRQGLRVPFIEAHCSGARFRGSGGVESWQQPVVALDLKTERVTLGFGIPEAVGRPPLAPHFFHAPLTPLPNTPLQPGETGIGYDIRLSADRVDYGPLHIQDGAVVISPDKNVKNGFRDCIISARGNFYNGRLDGQCVLGGGTDLLYAISLRAAGVNGLPLSKDMPILPIRSGRYDAEVSIRSQGRELERFLAQLHGHVQVRAQRGSVGLPESRNSLDFRQLDARLQLRSASWKEGRLGLDGQWSAHLEHKDGGGQARLDGRLWFGEDRDGQGTVVIRGVPVQADMRLQPSLTALPEAAQLKLGGRISCRGDQLEITEARLQTLGMDASGQARIRMDRGEAACQGALSVRCPDVQATLHRTVGKEVRVPPKLNSVSWQCEFNGTDRELSINKLLVQLDASRVSGSLKFAKREKKPFLGFELEVDRLDLSRYLHDKEDAALQKTSGNTGAKSWDFSFMRAFAAQGVLRIRELRGWRVAVQDVRLPLKLERGQLHNGPATGRFYGGSLRGQSSIDFSRGVRFNVRLSIRDFDLATASRDMGGDAVLSGTASMESDLHAALTGPGQMPAALDGLWNFAVIRGSYQERRPNGGLKGSPTRFDLASASGNFKSGVCRSGDFKLLGPDLQVRGGGMVDLNKRNLDCNLTVNMGRFKDIPVRLHGSLDKPETSIGAGTLIFAAIGGIVHGFMDVLGGILEGTWKIFR